MLPPSDPDAPAYEYEIDFEYPYGKFDVKLQVGPKRKKEDDELHLQPIPAEELPYFFMRIIPEPKSM